MPLTIVDRSPTAYGLLTANQAIWFVIDGSLALSSVILSVNDVVIYSNQVAHGGYAVTRTTLPGDQTRYEITPPDGWPYNTQLTVGVYAEQDAWWYRWFTGLSALWMDAYGEGESMDAGTARWDLYVEEDPSCFFGPINTFEESLLLPYSHYDSTLRFTEQLRTLLLDLAIARPQANRAIRWLFLHAHSNELAPVLRTLVPTPTTAEMAVRLCGQRSNVIIDAALRGKPGLLPAVLRELQTLGLPPAHAAMLQRYDIDDPNARVPMSCLAVCLAKVLETGTLAG